MSFPCSEIEKRIGYVFCNKPLLETAFTHSSYAHAHGGKDNERLEYLGDAVLQLAVTERQFLTSDKQEGELTKERQQLVCEKALLDAVQRLGIAKYLQIEGGASNVGKKTVASLFETVVAAIYLDGGYKCAKQFILRHLLKNAAVVREENPKGELQEYLQGLGAELPKYSSQKTGADNAPTFDCEATAQGLTAHGVGKSKREAESKAAKALLNALKEREK